MYTLEQLTQQDNHKIEITIGAETFMKKVDWKTAADIRALIGMEHFIAIDFFQKQANNAKTDEKKIEKQTQVAEASAQLELAILDQADEIAKYTFGNEFAKLFKTFNANGKKAIIFDIMEQLNTPSTK